MFYLVWFYCLYVDNGGHAYFFFSFGADHFAETLEALDRVGLQQFSAILTEAATVFFEGDVPRELDQREAIYRDYDATAVDDAYFAAGYGIEVYRALDRWYPAL